MSLSPLPTDPNITARSGPITAVYQSWFASIQQYLAPVGQNGTTSARPTKNLYVGQGYFDATLGKPIWVKQVSPSIIWVDATGGAV